MVGQFAKQLESLGTRHRPKRDISDTTNDTVYTKLYNFTELFENILHKVSMLRNASESKFSSYLEECWAQYVDKSNHLSRYYALQTN